MELIGADPRSRQRQRRWAETGEALRAAGLEALVAAGRGVIGQYGFVEFLTGYSPVLRPAYAVLVPGRDPVLVVSSEADAHLAAGGAVTTIRAGADGALGTVVVDVLSQEGVRAGLVGVAGLSDIAAVGDVDALRRGLPRVGFRDASGLLQDVKSIKDDLDLRELEGTAAIADRGFAALVDTLAPGVTGWEVSGRVEQALRSHGARDTLVYVSRDAHFVHRPRGEPFHDGDLVTAYVELIGPGGYWVELARLVAVGEIDGRRRALADACLEAAGAAEGNLTAGTPVARVAAAIEEVVQRAGATSGIWHGHGVGVDHDAPLLSTTDATVLRPNMVLAVHPNLTDNPLGASVGDTYVIGTGPPRRLSNVSPGLQRVRGDR